MTNRMRNLHLHKIPLNIFNFLPFRMMKITFPNIDRVNMHIVYHWNLQVHSITCIIETCFCLVTASTSLNCCKARLLNNNTNLVCLHLINRTIEVTYNEIMAITNRKTAIV